MKKIAYILFSLLFVANYSYSQGEVEALNFSRNELYGTARSMGMANAFGALGGDIGGIAINPAGIGVYRSSEIVGTLGFQQNATKVGDIGKRVNNFDMHNLGFVGYFPLRSDVVPMINFGFSFNRQKSFNNEYGAAGRDRTSSWTNFVVHRFGNIDVGSLGNNNGDPFLLSNGAPWMPILAYQGYLILPTKNGNNEQTGYRSILNDGDKVANYIKVEERGYIENYDFTMGTVINNQLNLGLSLNIANVNYNISSAYTEEFPSGNNEGFDINSLLKTQGAGFGVKAGAIYRPVNSLRIGLAYHSPVWYSMTDVYSAKMPFKIDSYLDKLSPENQAEYKKIENRTIDTGVADWSYSFQTPSKWIASVAFVIGSSFIVSLDYELTDYRKMKFSDNFNSKNNSYQRANDFIKGDYKQSSTVRAGLEYRFTKQFSGRLGYAWMQNPYKNVYRSQHGDAMTAGTISIYRMEGDTNYFTGGVGYRFNRNFYLDLAMVYKTQKDDLYPFSNILNAERTSKVIDAMPYKMKLNTVNGLLTLGYRF